MRVKIARFARTTFASLRMRNFRLYFAGQGISMMGGWVQSVAQSWLVLHLTNSGSALGIVSAIQFAPALLLGPYAGVLAERIPKRRLLIFTQTCLGLVALVLGLVVAAGAARPWIVYAAATVLGLVNAFDYPTRQAFLFELSGPSEVVSAIGLNASVANVARVVGPAIAGVLIAVTGLASCFLLNAASFAVVITCLFLMRPAELHLAERHGSEPGGLAEGLSYAARTPVVRESLVMMALVSVLTYEFSVTLPLLVKYTFDQGASGLAYLMSAMGVGAVMGGLITAGRRGDGLGRLSLAALAFGLCTAAVGLAPTPHMAAVALVFTGVFASRFTGLSNSILQLTSAPRMRSRVIALWSSAFMGSALVGAPLLGWMGQHLGARSALLVGAVGGVTAALVGWRQVRRSRTTAAALTPTAPAHEKAA